jgi:hypothetical protein
MMSEISSCCVSTRAVLEVLESCEIAFDHVENVDVDYSSDEPGRIDASVSVPLHDLIFRSLCKRVEPGGEARFMATPHVHQDSCIASSIEGVARVIHARIELTSGTHKQNLAYSISISDDAGTRCFHIVAAVPVDATRGSEIVLRRVSVVGCEMTLDIVPLRVIVGFNHDPAPEGRVYAAAAARDFLAMIQALGDGCSTEEADEVRRAIHSGPERYIFQAGSCHRRCGSFARGSYRPCYLCSGCFGYLFLWC